MLFDWPLGSGRGGDKHFRALVYVWSRFRRNCLIRPVLLLGKDSAMIACFTQRSDDLSVPEPVQEKIPGKKGYSIISCPGDAVP